MKVEINDPAPGNQGGAHLRSGFGPGLRLLWAASLAAALVGCAASPSSAPPPGEAAPEYEAAARAWLARDGLRAARVVVVEGEVWRRAADGAGTLAVALARAGIPGIEIEPRGRSFCARSAASPDCIFVTVRVPAGSDARLAEVDPEQVEAVVYLEPAPPEEGQTRMAWREELRTGRLVVFVRKPAAGSFSR